jgi:sporulation protein YlmC with PRC-barrel domain
MHSYAWKASAVIGDSVRNSAGENLGKIEDLILDPQTGTAAFAVLSFGGFSGPGGKLVAVPWTAFSLSATGDLLLDIDKDTLHNAPNFERDHWPDMADPVWHRRVHEYYGQPYVRPAGEYSVYSQPPGNRAYAYQNRGVSAGVAGLLILLMIGLLWFAFLVWTRGWETAKNDIRNSVGGLAYAMKEGSEDATLTAKVKTALSLSKRVPAGNIDVDSRDGIVTLRGEVSNEEVRSMAEQIARDTPGVVDVRNHLFAVSSTQ